MEKFLKNETLLPTRISILNGQAINAKGEVCLSAPFQPDVDYFEVDVDQLYLAHQSKLWVKLDPTLIVATQFSYAGKKDVPIPVKVGVIYDDFASRTNS